MIVKTFETKSAQKRVDDFIKVQDLSTRKKIAFRINLLERFGMHLGMPYSRKITGNLYELRMRGKVEVRIIYSFKNNYAVLLHVFKKKQDKLPQREIETARSRLSALDSI